MILSGVYDDFFGYSYNEYLRKNIFEYGSLYNLPLSDSCIDFFIIKGELNDFSLKEISRVLKDGGFIIRIFE